MNQNQNQMKFGAHETMETHEILMEKLNAITHCNLYAKQAKNPKLRDMIARHQRDAINSYNEIVSLTRGGGQFTPISTPAHTQGVQHQQIQYGLDNPPRFAPQNDDTLSDHEISTAMLICHKNGARNAAWAALECADPNLRRAMQNSAQACTDHAYEVFLFLNEQGLYQVPTMKTETTHNFLGSYQPATGMQQSQYGAQTGYSTGGYSSGFNASGNEVGIGYGSVTGSAAGSPYYGDVGGQDAGRPSYPQGAQTKTGYSPIFGTTGQGHQQ
ncbi:spore coat protein [Paenibacillus terreus]|uniref:Spore coat protein n=1 Tax=Paenibacillus terreus TaxID=1387834 RepID=A0ABV5BB13_9BACL